MGEEISSAFSGRTPRVAEWPTLEASACAPYVRGEREGTSEEAGAAAEARCAVVMWLIGYGSR